MIYYIYFAIITLITLIAGLLSPDNSYSSSRDIPIFGENSKKSKNKINVWKFAGLFWIIANLMGLLIFLK